MKRKLLGAAVASVLVLGGAALVPPAGAQENHEHGDGGGHELGDVLPMIFVHGGLGSGQQFEAQALRFASNGYPSEHIDMFEHNSLAWPGDEAHQEEIWTRLDGQIDDLLAATGAAQVVLLGHSQGTGLSQGYLHSSPERVARVAKYINLDGSPTSDGGSVPDEVETLAIWSRNRGDTAELEGATNVHLTDQGHTEVVNSPEGFEEMYRFVIGEDPFTTGVVREPADEIVVGGRVQLFPENVGAEGATLRIFEIDGETGLRLDETPEAAFEIDESGDWGPFEASGEAFYEFAITRTDSDVTHHVYPQQFVRSNPWMRVLTSLPGGLSDSFWEFSDDHVNMVMTRNKEWWGTTDGDVLEINGQSILNETNSPPEDSIIGMFVYDAGLDKQSDVTTPVSPIGINFLMGADLYLPAADPPDGTVGVVATPRRGDGIESVCIPNYPSASHRSSIQFNSYHHMVNPDGSPAEGHANPQCAPAAPRPGTPAPPVAGSPGFTG